MPKHAKKAKWALKYYFFVWLSIYNIVGYVDYDLSQYYNIDSVIRLYIGIISFSSG